MPRSKDKDVIQVATTDKEWRYLTGKSEVKVVGYGNFRNANMHSAILIKHFIMYSKITFMFLLNFQISCNYSCNGKTAITYRRI